MNHLSKYRELFDKHALAYQKKYFELEGYHEVLNHLYQLTKMKNPSILDLACGPANISYFLKNKFENCKIKGIDISAQMINLAKNNLPEGEFEIQDIRMLRLSGIEFDIVISGFATPYLSKVELIEFISKCSTLLKGQGLLYLSTIEGKYTDSSIQTSSSGDDSMFIYLHEKDYVVDAIESAGLNIMYMDRVNINRDDVDLVLIAQKNI